jgi:hypothetical protein
MIEQIPQSLIPFDENREFEDIAKEPFEWIRQARGVAYEFQDELDDFYNRLEQFLEDCGWRTINTANDFGPLRLYAKEFAGIGQVTFSSLQEAFSFEKAQLEHCWQKNH